MADELQLRYEAIKKVIPENVTLVAVSKMQPIDALVAVYQLGQKIFGENYVQELIEKVKKFESLQIKDVKFHFIGHLQTNKVKMLLPFVDCIESVDSFRVMAEIDRQAKELNRNIPCFFQVNIDEEPSKSGFLAEQLDELSAKIHSYENIKPRGLMAIPDPARSAHYSFQRMKEFSNKYASSLGNELSMGMSHDYLEAISEGATMVRVGSKIFGERKLFSD